MKQKLFFCSICRGELTCAYLQEMKLCIFSLQQRDNFSFNSNHPVFLIFCDYWRYHQLSLFLMQYQLLSCDKSLELLNFISWFFSPHWRPRLWKSVIHVLNARWVTSKTNRKKWHASISFRITSALISYSKGWTERMN